ncbi:hypothetical protein [Bradyrhizobium sp. 6(2017)]|uniref:hypothetical protein n=1 Tax=Bradyrhizobium sp. 6(2017) TaxID=1197460 RepID=UPI0013E1C340|nr:hypothetical protein [Bradyrhizobium sp. 6(2017)]QIG91847.1 hypothetical protein G6P99_04540 [Bradyrhizobium sp. 6(2017)]
MDAPASHRPFLYLDKGTPAEYGAALKHTIAQGWLEIHESGTYVKILPAGNDLFA